MNVDWRWRELFNIIRCAYPDSERTALWRTSCLLRTKMHTSRK